MGLLASQVINGLTNTSILFLVAVGLVVIFGLLDVVNMAHGEFIMFGAYSAVVCVNTLHLPFVVAVLIAALFTALIGSVVERFIIQRLYGKVAETLLGTFALSYIFQQLVRTIFGPEDQLMALPIDTTLHFGSIVVPVYNVVLLVVSVIVLAGTLLLLIKTKFGMQLRANVQNRTMVQCLGVNSARIDNLTFSYGCALAGLAGALIAPVKSVTPDMGVTYVVDSFMVVVLGGLNSIFGSFMGSFVVSESSTVMAGYMSEITAKLLIFIVIIGVIRFRPQGLFFNKDKR
ncbi:urea ABC transporter permease subunit UrtB [Megasphaera paucivorans]|uniref:Urea transport system permease protein n=1 Tax=Megasphaera paucivorans TaxID=349095 RepID=A0A1G9SFW2_9FIRM|nr:urea ABC transporter permease subunit UrtB [Megasphaera paucivorans]SDM34329.1 urea transport system permease protein [Megasphaera paucivorans]